MHKYLLTLDDNKWSILSDLAHHQNRSIAGCLRQLIEDAAMDKLYGKGGMFPDQLPKISSLLHKKLVNIWDGRCEVIEIDVDDGCFKVLYEDEELEEREHWYSLEFLDSRKHCFWEAE